MKNSFISPHEGKARKEPRPLFNLKRLAFGIVTGLVLASVAYVFGVSVWWMALFVLLGAILGIADIEPIFPAHWFK